MMFKTMKEGFAKEVELYGLFVSILIILAIVFLIIGFVLIVFFPQYSEKNCGLKIAFASIGTFIASMGLINRAKKASSSAGRKK